MVTKLLEQEGGSCTSELRSQPLSSSAGVSEAVDLSLKGPGPIWRCQLLVILREGI
jgi:hypothetical protein